MRKFLQRLRDWISRHIFLKSPGMIDFCKWAFAHSGLSDNPLYRRFTLRRSRNFAARLPYGGIGLSIETALSCNAHCIMCAHSVTDMRGFMDENLFRKIIAQAASRGVTCVGLSVYGEPLLDPLFLKRLRIVVEAGLKYSFFTNASLLDKRITDSIFEIGGLVRINFSVCGFRKDVYEAVMKGLNRDTVYENIAYFLSRKGNSKLPEVSISTVKTKINKSEMKDFVRFWKGQKGVNHVVTADLWERMRDKDVSEVGALGSMHRLKGWKAPCYQLWGPFSVYFDGRVAPCCDDNDRRELIVGDLTKQSLEEVIRGEAMAQLRQAHLNDQRAQHPVCRFCSHDSLWFWP